MPNKPMQRSAETTALIFRQWPYAPADWRRWASSCFVQGSRCVSDGKGSKLKEVFMHKFQLALLLTVALAASASLVSGQKKQAQCEQGPNQPRNWELLGKDYVYFDYSLCPAGMNPPQPLVRVWITTRGEGIAVEKWVQDRDGTDVVSMFHEKKKVYTIYRDLNAVPLTVFKAERRSSVPADMAGQPFLAEGNSLIPFENLTPESAEKVRKVFENADAIIKSAQHKVALIFEAPRIGVIVDALDTPLKAR